MKRTFLYLLVAVATISAIEPADAQINTSDPGVTINGVTWATRNVGVKGKFMDNYWNHGLFYTFEEARTACPFGWHAPTREEFDTLVQSESEWIVVNGVAGRQYGSGVGTLFMPAAGFRDPYGTTAGQGNDGYYWSSTPTESASHHLNFHPAEAGSVGRNASRGDGFTLRCVRR